jgi:CheY-like chemotaxis protein
VLYIEDDPGCIALVERLLRRRPQTDLRVAMNAAAGVKAATDAQPALILLDNRLPDATGAEILGQLASSAATAKVPVVILTGDSDPGTAHELIASGAREFLAKPFDIYQFLAMVDRYLPAIIRPQGGNPPVPDAAR